MTTIKLWRSAVLKFHHTPSSITSNNLLVNYITQLERDAPPLNIHRPTVDLSPTLAYLTTLDNSTCSLSALQSKTAFLLGMAAFLRPSDLHRIQLSTASVDDTSGILQFVIRAPKERRHNRRILKPVLIHPHRNQALCPVSAFLAVSDHTNCKLVRPPDSLFVNSKNPSKAIAKSTIASWLRKLIARSTSEHRVSVRSLASSLALRSGIPLDDIQTLGNWTNSATFQNHYRREHLSQVDFTNTVLSLNSGSFEATLQDSDLSDEEDLFVDAPEEFTDA